MIIVIFTASIPPLIPLKRHSQSQEVSRHIGPKECFLSIIDFILLETLLF
jgi:hypothetical protein